MSNDPQLLRTWRRNILVSTWLAYAGLYFCRKAFWAAKGTLGRDLDLSAADLGEIGVAYLIAYTIGQFLSAGNGMRFGARKLLLTGMAVSIGCNIVFGFANNYWTLTAFMVLNGLAQATGWPAVVGTIGRWTTRSERGTLMGFWGTCYQIGGVAATAWAAFWLAQMGLKGAFLMASLVTFGCWCAVFAWQRNEPADVGLEPLDAEDEVQLDANGEAPSFWTRQLITNLGLIGVFYFGVKFVRYALWSWTPYLLESNFGLQPDQAGYLSTVFDFAGFLGVITAGIVSDKLFRGKRTPPSFIMLIGMMAATALLYSVGGTSTVFFAICLGLIGFMLFGPDSLMTGAGAIEVGHPRMAVATAGIINGLGSLGSVVQDLVIGRLLTDSPDATGPVFQLLVGASLLSVTALGVLLVRTRMGKADL